MRFIQVGRRYTGYEECPDYEFYTIIENEKGLKETLDKGHIKSNDRIFVLGEELKIKEETTLAIIQKDNVLMSRKV